MSEQPAGRSQRWFGRAAFVVVPSAITAIAFSVGWSFGMLGTLPLWLLLTLLFVGSACGELTGRWLTEDASAVALHFGVGSQILGVTAIIYAIGWGPTLAIGYVFVVARVLAVAGARVWRIALGWMFVGMAFGELAIAANIVDSYVATPYVHWLAGLSALGTGFVMWLLAAKTSETSAADHEVRTALSLLTATLDATADGILVVDSRGAITHFNAQFVSMWRLPGDHLHGREDSPKSAFVLDQLARPELYVATLDEVAANPESESDDALEFKDGRVFERHSRPQKIDDTTVGRVWSFRDVTDRNRLLNELTHQAFHDSLTGLANRALVRDRLDHALARSRRSAATVAVLFCDLDRFKMINDTLGHDAGDVLLIEVARRFEHNLRDGDTAARLGGDEFAVVLDETSLNDARSLAQRLLDALRDPFEVSGREIFVRASIGIATNEAYPVDADELLCQADIAMYAAKSHGRDRVEIFASEMQEELTSHHELYGDLRHAISTDQLVVHYQPLLDLERNQIESFEALVRWQHPTRGLIGPDDFIPIAEESGLIIDLGRFVLREACRQVAAWRWHPGMSELLVGVNISAHQLYDDGFVATVVDALRDAALPATSLILELTESTLLSDTALVQHRLEALKQLGVRVAIDDFGTGYSSLAYLRAFPIDFLKIDRSFVNELGGDDSNEGRIMIQSIIDIGQNLRLGVVAEGIEEPEQLAHLRDAGCTTGQGYLFARPLPADEIPMLLDRYAASAHRSA